MSISRTQIMFNQQLNSCRVVRDTNLTGKYFNGTSNNGVGATFSASTPGALTIDGVSPNVGDRVILVDQTDLIQNGIYVVKDNSANWILQRSADFQCIEQLKAGQYLTIDAGANFKGALYVLVEPLPVAIGFGDIHFRSTTSNGTLGTAAFKDASNNNVDLVASLSTLPTVANHFATFADVSGTIEDTGFVMSDPNEPVVASVTGATALDNVAVFADTVGTVQDGGVLIHDLQLRTNIHAARTVNIGGGGAGPITVSAPGTTATSIVVATIDSSTNTVAVASCDATSNAFDVTFTGDPGANCTLNYVVFFAAQ